MVEKIKAKLYTYDRLSMRNKKFTHMTSKVTWFGSHIGFARKHIQIFSRKAGQIEGKLQKMFPKPWGYNFFKE